MKTFHEQFKDRIDFSDGSVVLREDEYNFIVSLAFKAGQQHTMNWVSKECSRILETINERRSNENLQTNVPHGPAAPLAG